MLAITIVRNIINLSTSISICNVLNINPNATYNAKGFEGNNIFILFLCMCRECSHSHSVDDASLWSWSYHSHVLEESYFILPFNAFVLVFLEMIESMEYETRAQRVIHLTIIFCFRSKRPNHITYYCFLVEMFESEFDRMLCIFV